MGRNSTYDAAYKAKVALEAIKEQRTLAELAKEFNVSPSMITTWKMEFLANASQAFTRPESQKKQLEKLQHENEKLLKKVGQLTVEVDFFAEAYEKSGIRKKK